MLSILADTLMIATFQTGTRAKDRADEDRREPARRSGQLKRPWWWMAGLRL